MQDAANSDRHHLYNLLQYGKLYLAPISDDVQVRVLSACQDVTLTIFLESPRRRYRNGYLGDVYSCSYPTNPSPADTLHREFADLFPSATVTGTDLSPIQPSWVPPNVQFEVDDCTDEWLYGKDTPCLRNSRSRTRRRKSEGSGLLVINPRSRFIYCVGGCAR